MSPSIWTRCAGVSEIRPLSATVHRVVESQTMVSTRKLTDSDAEQAVLEALVESVKPKLPDTPAFAGLHYLLATPFRHPPLRHGSRFGSRTEPSLFYGSVSLHTAFAEVAYYRFLFLAGTTAKLDLVTTELTAFRVPIRTKRGVDLTGPAFAPCDARIHSKTTYKDTQPLGREMREAGVLAFLFRSARDPEAGKNVALYAPVFTKKVPTAFSQWVSTTSQSRVEIAARDPLHPSRIAFARERFEVKGVLPDPGRGG
jgi:hypothetical protein